MNEVDLGFAGRYHERHRLHSAIAALSPGDLLKVRVTETQRWELLDQDGNVVGRLAGGFTPPDGMRCLSVTVLAVVTRTRELTEPQYQDSVKCDTWEVVVPELVFGLL